MIKLGAAAAAAGVLLSGAHAAYENGLFLDPGMPGAENDIRQEIKDHKGEFGNLIRIGGEKVDEDAAIELKTDTAIGLKGAGIDGVEKIDVLLEQSTEDLARVQVVVYLKDKRTFMAEGISTIARDGVTAARKYAIWNGLGQIKEKI